MSVGCLLILRFLPFFIFIFSYSNYHPVLCLPSSLGPTLADFTARMKLAKGRCAHGVRLVCTDEKKKQRGPTVPVAVAVVPRHLHKHSDRKGSGGSPRNLGGWEHEGGMCINSNVHRTCIDNGPLPFPPCGAIGQWHLNLNHEVQMVAGRQSGADVGSPRPT